jgi:glycerol transport system ATP-binding protein
MSVRLDGINRVVRGETHLSDISFEMAKGSLNVLLGATRSGKTSLMRVLAGLDAPSKGRLFIDGKDVTGVPVRRRDVAMVYQQFINYPTMTVYENIASPLRVAGAKAADLDQKVRRAADLLKLVPYLDRTPLQLSGGQQQRTAIARAVVKGAGLVLMDEPLANLDYKLREELREELPKIFAETGAILVYATTEPTEALLLGGRTATLHEGRVTQYGAASAVYRQPKDLTTAQVFSDPPLNCMAAVKRDASLTVRGVGEIALTGAQAELPDGDYTLGVRAHHLSLDPLPGSLALPGLVSVSEITGSESFVHIDAPNGRFVALARGVREFLPGAQIQVHVDLAHLLFFKADGALALATDLTQDARAA